MLCQMAQTGQLGGKLGEQDLKVKLKTAKETVIEVENLEENQSIFR